MSGSQQPEPREAWTPAGGREVSGATRSAAPKSGVSRPGVPTADMPEPTAAVAGAAVQPEPREPWAPLEGREASAETGTAVAEPAVPRAGVSEPAVPKRGVSTADVPDPVDAAGAAAQPEPHGAWAPPEGRKSSAATGMAVSDPTVTEPAVSTAGAPTADVPEPAVAGVAAQPEPRDPWAPPGSRQPSAVSGAVMSKSAATGAAAPEQGGSTAEVPDPAATGTAPQSEPRDPWAPPGGRRPSAATGTVTSKSATTRTAAPKAATPNTSTPTANLPVPNGTAPNPPGGRYDVPPPPPAPGSAGAYAPPGSGTPPIFGAGADGQRGAAPNGSGGRPDGDGGFPPGTAPFPHGAPTSPYGSSGPGGWGPYPADRSGQHVPSGYQPYWMPIALNNGFGTAALVLGIVGTVLFFTVAFGLLLGLLAIVFGAIGRSKADRGEADNGGSALAGLIMGGVAMLLSVLMVCYVVVANATYVDDDPWGPGYSDDSGFGGPTSGGSGSGTDDDGADTDRGPDDDGPGTYEAAPAPGPRTASDSRTYEAAPASAVPGPTAVPDLRNLPAARTGTQTIVLTQL